MDTPPGILAIFPYLPSHELDLSAPLLLLDSIKDPGNMGTILRSADWFGYTQVICSPDCVDIYNPKTVASSMGSLARMHVQHSPLATFIDQHPSYHYYALTLTGEDYQHIPYQHPIALITGSESHGISDTLLHKNLTQIRIPSKGSKTESLNAAIATAIALAQVSQHS